MPKPSFASKPTFEIVGDAFEFQVGRLSGNGTVDLTEGTFSIENLQVTLPSGVDHALPAAEHLVDLPLPPPIFDLLV